MATIRQYSNGRWQAIIRRKSEKPVSKTFASKHEAGRWARLLESEIDRGVFVDRTEAQRTRLGDLMERYLCEVTPRKKCARNEAQRVRFLKQHFGAVAAASLQSKHVAAYRDTRLAEGKAGATVIKELNTLSHIIDTAIRHWGVPLHSNPVRLARRRHRFLQMGRARQSLFRGRQPTRLGIEVSRNASRGRCESRRRGSLFRSCLGDSPLLPAEAGRVPTGAARADQLQRARLRGDCSATC
jgi:hypothetical protein